MERLPVKDCRKHQAGLTLIEVLIALAIIGIALTAVIKAASENIRFTSYLQHKTLALWVGQSVINETRAGVIKLPAGDDWSNNAVTMLGEDWRWQGKSESTANEHIRKIVVNVFSSDEEAASPVVTLESFIYVQ